MNSAGFRVKPGMTIQQNEKRVKAGDLVDKEEAATHVAWYYALVILADMILSLVYWMILNSLGYELTRPWQP